jgi:hypothetical protein
VPGAGIAGWRGAKANASSTAEAVVTRERLKDVSCQAAPAFEGPAATPPSRPTRLFATDPFAAIALVQGLPFLSAVALVWLERLGDRKLRKIAAIRLKLSLRADPLEEVL